MTSHPVASAAPEPRPARAPAWRGGLRPRRALPAAALAAVTAAAAAGLGTAAPLAGQAASDTPPSGPRPGTSAPRPAPAPPRGVDPDGPVLTLREAVDRAVEVDPAAVGAASRTSSARADLLQARGAWLPSLSAGGIYGNSSNERFDQTTGRLVSESYTAQLQASYEVFGGGRRLARGRSAGAAVEAAEADFRAQRFRTILTTTQVFYATAAAAELVDAASQRLDRARQQLDFARTRLELGTVTRSDVLRAEIEVGDAELALLEARASLRATALELGRRVGEEGTAYPAAEALPDRAPALPTPEELVERARRSAPEVVAAEAERESRRMDRLAAWTPYLPSVRLSAGYDWFSFQFPPDQESWSVRLFASLPLFDGFQREATLQRATAQERAARASAADALRGVRARVETAAQDVELAERRVDISDRAVALAREDLRVQEERYQIGNATILDLQTSQVALADAEVAAIRARQALGSAVAGLEAVLGESLTENPTHGAP